MSQFRITEQANIFDDHLLDIIGNEFKFDHAKGLAEWVKNAVDAYNRETDKNENAKYADDDQYIYIRFNPKTDISPITFECIDFVGMTHSDIENAFKRWGDPNAASRGKGKKFLGGHGNGGKFYMRQMFKEAGFVTYRGGKLNVFGFNAKKKYGFDSTYENKQMGLKRAVELANIGNLLPHVPQIIRRKLEKGECGFTVVWGEAPDKIKRKNSPRSIIQRLCVHPQARRLVHSKPIYAVVGDQAPFKLESEQITARPGFEGPFEYDVPALIEVGGNTIPLANEKYQAGKLKLFTSSEPFNRHGDRASLNCIDIVGEIGVIGSYRMHELGQIRNFTEVEFIYGQCYCPIMEDPDDDCVRNDREKLIENEKSAALLSWICQKVNDLADKMASKTASEAQVQELKQSSAFNEFLNSWMRKSRFWEQLQGEIFGGNGIGSGFGGTGGGGGPLLGKKNSKGKDNDKSAGPNDGDGGGKGDDKKKGPKFPVVLLSNFDTDPLSYTPTVSCEPGHPPVYQRDVDVPEGIFWINTQSPFAKKIRESKDYGPDSTRWREYMFQRHMDIIIKQAIYETEKRESNLSAALIDGLLDKISKQVYAAAADDVNLQSFLFKENLDAAQVQNTLKDEPYAAPKASSSTLSV